MGGCYTLMIREQDGSVQSYEAWTSSIPCCVQNVKTFKGERDHFDSYLKAIEAKKVDNIPGGYGIVVVDFKDKIIVSYQQYSNPADQFYPGIHLEVMNTYVGDPDEETEIQRLDALFAYSRNNKLWVAKDSTFKSWEKISLKDIYSVADFMKAYPPQMDNTQKRHRYEVGRVVWDCKPFRIYHKNNIRAAFKSLQKHGFQFTPNEIKVWKNFDKEDY